MGRDPRSVVVTGASRGLGLATALRLHRQGWTVVAAMRSPDVGAKALRDAGGVGSDDDRLVPVKLDLDDARSVAAAGAAILDAVGPPDAVVHNAGVAGVGSVEEMPPEAYEQILRTNFVGPVLLTKALLPSMRDAGRGRIVVVSSQGAASGMPGISAYSAAKSAIERWGEALAYEVSPFGLGVTVLVAGTFKTDILELTTSHADPDGPYAPMHDALLAMQPRMLRIARPPEQFAEAVERALADRAPFVRRGVGPDAHAALAGARMLPVKMFQRAVRMGLRLPRPERSRDA